ncbi:MAG TPA: DUF6265 family protein [Vicinamibacteria bacterium]|jgi:hypothetical protein
MKTPSFLALIVLCLPSAPVRAGDALDDLAWIAGTWEGTADGMAMEEHWLEPSGGTMLGLHRDVAGGRTVSFEFLRIEAGPDGVAYVAQPGGRPPTRFALVERGKDRVVFANPAHDFPQRILYWRDAAGLHARVEGKEKGVDQAMEWTWRKAR